MQLLAHCDKRKTEPLSPSPMPQSADVAFLICLCRSFELIILAMARNKAAGVTGHVAHGYLGIYSCLPPLKVFADHRLSYAAMTVRTTTNMLNDCYILEQEIASNHKST